MKSYNPQLVTLSGDGDLEYVGFHPAIARGIAKVGKRMFRGIRKRRQQRRASRRKRAKGIRQQKAMIAEFQRQENIRSIQFEMQRKEQQKNTKNIMLIGGGSLAALLLLLKARRG